MKIIFKGMALLAAAGMVALSCVKEVAQVEENEAPVITAVTASGDAATKASMTEAEDGLRSIVWDKGDALSVFLRNSFPQKYVLDGEGGTTKGLFKHQSGVGIGEEFPQVYAVYPYSSNTSFKQGFVSTFFPYYQYYREDNFPAEANLMVGVAEPGEKISFKNVGGYLVLQLYGEDVKVKNIQVKSRGGERLAGPVYIGVEPGKAPEVRLPKEEQAEQLSPSLLVRSTPSDDDAYPSGWGYEYVWLSCKDSVKVGTTAETATSFWFVLLPQELKKGFNVSVETNKGTFKFSQKSSIEIQRSAVCRMDPLEVKDAIITFKDKNLETYLVSKGVDKNGDGKISEGEAAAVTVLPLIFDCPMTTDFEHYESPYTFTSFDEFVYFTGIQERGSAVFAKWSKLKSITIPETLTFLPDNMFNGCTALTTVTLNEGLTGIGYNCFYGCTALESITIPEGVQAFYAGCFAYSGIKSFTTPKSTTYMMGGIFNGCPNLETLVIQGACINTQGKRVLWGGAFGSMPALKSVTIEDVEEINMGCFGECPKVTSVTLKEGLKRLDDAALRFPALTSLVVPASVTYLGGGTFYYTTSLKSLTLLATTPSEQYNPDYFNSSYFPADCKVYVPAASVAAYKAHFNNSESRIFPIQ